MKITEAFKKSKVVRRASQMQLVYEIIGVDLVSNGVAVSLNLESLNANDWQFQTVAWKGSAETKKEKSK